MIKTADKLPQMHSMEIRGVPIVIQWPKGSTRTGTRKDGTSFRTEMKAAYGFVEDTVAAGDSERLDVYIGDDANAENAYIVEQVRKPNGDFDEYKILLNFSSLEDAEELYNYQLGDDADVEMGDISEVPFNYLFDVITKEQKQNKEQRREETETKIEEDEQKIAAYKTKPISPEWRKWLNENLAEDFKRLDLLALRDKLLSFGGEEALIKTLDNPPDEVSRLMKRGQLWIGRKAKFKKMEHNNCHGNSVCLMQEGYGEVVNGYALSQDGLWRAHSWLITPDGGLIETTVRRIAYFGAVLTREEVESEYGSYREGLPDAYWTESKRKRGGSLSVIDSFIKNYKHTFDFYEEVAKQAAEELEETLQEAGIKAAVTYRAKRPRRLRQKLINRNEKRHYQSFRDIYNDIVDLAGVRVALYFPADRPAVGTIVEEIFAPVRAPKEFPRDRDSGDGVDYHATHYLVQLRPETLHKEELRYADTNIEIQIASVLMSAVAEISHDLIYKPEKGALTPEERRIIQDLNAIVEAGEAKLTQLQNSMEARNGEDLRFELTASLTKLAKQLELRSLGLTATKLNVLDIVKVARQITFLDKDNVHSIYLQAKTALWQAHLADELDDRLRQYNEKLKKTLPIEPPNEEIFIYRALEQLYPGTQDITSLPKEDQYKVTALAQELKRNV